ncbi:MAG: sulfotransferase [Dongiaceae bacterium]
MRHPTAEDSGAAGKTAPPAASRMDIAVMGLMRSGSTLLSDLLTIRGECLILSEPNILGRWSPTVVDRIHKLAANFGLDPGPTPPVETEWPSYGSYFDKVLLPQLGRLPRWGTKYVDLVDWRPTLARYRPKHLILTVRDIRDVAISSIDRVARLKLAFRGRRYMRDDAWVMSNLAFNVHELMAMRSEPHLLVRYEDMASDPAIRQRVADFVGFERLSDRRENLEAGGMARQWELRKHGEGISTRSVGRYREEPWGPVKALADRLWRLLPEYSEAFGYEIPPPETWIRGHDFSKAAADGKNPARNPIVYRRSETRDWTGPAQLEPVFALRRARAFIAGRLPAEARILELGCGTPALQSLLVKGAQHLPADVAARAENYRVSRLDALEFPDGSKATHILAFGILELLGPELAAVLRQLRLYDRPVIATYHAADDTADLDRAAYGWVNHLTRAELAAACRAAGFRFEARWARFGRQSFIHLRPLRPEARPAAGKPGAGSIDRGKPRRK